MDADCTFIAPFQPWPSSLSWWDVRARWRVGEDAGGTVTVPPQSYR
jgi:hypothetical protein